MFWVNSVSDDTTLQFTILEKEVQCGVRTHVQKDVALL
jgi:hypothetical protein